MCVIVPIFAKIGQNVLEIWPIFDFPNILHVKLENAYLRPQNRVFGAFYPQNREQCERNPKGHILRRKHVV